MGTWGYEIDQDDFVCDIIADFENTLKQNQDIQKTGSVIISTYQDDIEDPDDGPLFWIALASMQWKYGSLDAAVLQQVKTDFENENGLERWRELGEDGYVKRKEVITKYVDKISVTNAKPKKLPKIVVRKPVYQAGDCLSIQLPNGMFGAALVLAADHSNVEYGQNLIGVLNYMKNIEPDISIFEKRDWLILSHHNWENQPDICWYIAQGYRNAKNRFKQIGKVSISSRDPQQSNCYAGWEFLANQVMDQRNWEKDHSGN